MRGVIAELFGSTYKRKRTKKPYWNEDRNQSSVYQRESISASKHVRSMKRGLVFIVTRLKHKVQKEKYSDF